MTRTSVDITIPVLNEEGSLVSTLTTLAAHLDTQCPYDWGITVADNGSTDGTFELATAFAAANHGRESSGWKNAAGGEPSNRHGRPARPTSWSTWTSISPRGSSRCDRSSTPSSKTAARSRSARGSPRAPKSPGPCSAR